MLKRFINICLKFCVWLQLYYCTYAPICNGVRYNVVFTVSSKIIRALEIIRVKNLYLMQFYEINICQVMIFRLYTVYNKHNDDKNWRSNHRKIASIIAFAPVWLLSTVIL